MNRVSIETRNSRANGPTKKTYMAMPGIGYHGHGVSIAPVINNNTDKILLKS